MLPYILLVLFPIGVSLYEKYGVWKRERRFLLERDVSSMSLLAFFALFLLLLFVRDESVGCDVVNYHYAFRQALKVNFVTLFDCGFEPLFLLFNCLFAWILRFFRLFLIACAILAVVPVAWFYLKKSPMPLLSVALFLGAAPFSFYFSGLRQTIAMAMMIPMFELARQKKLKAFLIAGALTCLIHKSAVVGFLLYPLFRFRITPKHMWVIGPVMLAVLLGSRPLLRLILSLVGSYGDKYADIGGTGAYGMLALFAIFTVYCFVMPDESALRPEDVALRNLMVFILAIQLFVPSHNLFMRLGYYYHIFLPVIIPRMAIRTKPKLRRLMQCSVIVMQVFFFGYFIWNGYTDADVLEIYPYLFPWQ